MSAIEQLPPSSEATSPDRRITTRHRLGDTLSVILGRGEGTLVDISASGARVRHSAPARLGSRVRLSFEWEKQRFSATAVVLASRVVALGSLQGGATQFESRLRFVAASSEAAEILADFVQSLEARELRKWVANLRGWANDGVSSPGTEYFVRCRRIFARWERKWTRDSSQPEDGFTVPASIEEHDLALLCRMWDSSSDDEREVLRNTARASVEGCQDERP